MSEGRGMALDGCILRDSAVFPTAGAKEQRGTLGRPNVSDFKNMPLL